jgi:hypothetical protein
MNTEQLYENILRDLPAREKLKLLERLARDLVQAETPSAPGRSLLELEGRWAGLLKGKDAQEYVNEIREEWSHRP